MFEKQLVRGFIAATNVVPPLIVVFQFNPILIADNKAVNYADRNASLCNGAPGKLYTGGGHRTITFDLKLHGLEQSTNSFNTLTENSGISTELAKLRSFMYPKSDAWSFRGKEGKRLSSPPTCIFGFGNKILECVVTDLKITETQFNSALAPVRADINITLTVIEDVTNALYQVDRQHRNALAAFGSQNIKRF